MVQDASISPLVAFEFLELEEMSRTPLLDPPVRPVGPPPINSEKRPQADISVSRPVSTQFCFYPLRIIPQGTQSEGLRMRSDFGGVENSMFLAQYEIFKSGGASGLWKEPPGASLS